MRKKKYAKWRADSLQPDNKEASVLAHVTPKYRKMIRRIAFDDIPPEKIPPDAVRMDENYADNNADVRILSWITDDGTLHCWTDADAIQMTDDSHTIFADLPLAEEIDLSRIDTSRMTQMKSMFMNDRNLRTVDLSGMDTSNVYDMSSMFDGCEMLESVNLSGIDASNVVDTRFMFRSCASLSEIDLSAFEKSKIINIRSMFDGCESLTSLDVSPLDTSRVKNFSRLFACTGLHSLDLSAMDMSSARVMSDMVAGCSYLRTINLPHGTVSNPVSTFNVQYSGA